LQEKGEGRSELGRSLRGQICNLSGTCERKDPCLEKRDVKGERVDRFVCGAGKKKGGKRCLNKRQEGDKNSSHRKDLFLLVWESGAQLAVKGEKKKRGVG